MGTMRSLWIDSIGPEGTLLALGFANGLNPKCSMRQ